VPWDSWIARARDIAIVSVGTFMLIYETVFVINPNAYLIGAGLAALGLPPALRLDLRTRGDRRERSSDRPRRRADRDEDDDESDRDGGWGEVS
jgi:hypothetical protein